MTEKELEPLIDVFFATGATVIDTAGGKRLFFVASDRLPMPKGERGILIAYEGAGAYFWQIGSELTKYTLFANGFSFIVAPIIVRTVETIRQRYKTVYAPSKTIEHARKRERKTQL